MIVEIDLASIDLNLLVLFEVVLTERHVGRAAQKLHVSPSAVSHGLARLRRLLKDPLFLRTPKGVVPTERASELAQPIADILASVRKVVATATPFDPKTSSRRFSIGAPDGTAVVIMPRLLAALRRSAPTIDFSVRNLLPHQALDALDARDVDVAIAALEDLPPRFVGRRLHDEDFVVAARAGHPFLVEPTLDRYCQERHVLVSAAGDAHGFVDEVLAEQGRSRRVALVVPHFMLALAALAESDLVGALPRSFVARYGANFDVQSREPPVPLLPARLSKEMRAIATCAAMMDAGVAWLVEQLMQVAGPKPARRSTRPRGREQTARARKSARR